MQTSTLVCLVFTTTPSKSTCNTRYPKYPITYLNEIPKKRSNTTIEDHEESTKSGGPQGEPASQSQNMSAAGIVLAEAREYGLALKEFIVGEDGLSLLDEDRSWVPEDILASKLGTWVAGTAADTLWVSTSNAITEAIRARAAALATIQVLSTNERTKDRYISHVCQRVQPEKLRAGMTIEKMGLIGLVYSLIYQLLQFGKEEDKLDIEEEEFAELLTGDSRSWARSLEVLQVLLGQSPQLKYCVIDGLDDLECDSGEAWCEQFLAILRGWQRQEGKRYNILFTTAGHSAALDKIVGLGERFEVPYMAPSEE